MASRAPDGGHSRTGGGPSAVSFGLGLGGRVWTSSKIPLLGSPTITGSVAASLPPPEQAWRRLWSRGANDEGPHPGPGYLACGPHLVAGPATPLNGPPDRYQRCRDRDSLRTPFGKTALMHSALIAQLPPQRWPLVGEPPSPGTPVHAHAQMDARSSRRTWTRQPRRGSVR